MGGALPQPFSFQPSEAFVLTSLTPPNQMDPLMYLFYSLPLKFNGPYLKSLFYSIPPPMKWSLPKELVLLYPPSPKWSGPYLKSLFYSIPPPPNEVLLT